MEPKNLMNAEIILTNKNNIIIYHNILAYIFFRELSWTFETL